MKYEFHVGDYVEDVTGRIGYINSICQCKRCKERGFYELCVMYNNGDCDYITVYEYEQYEQGFPNYNRIGKYDFTKKDNNKIEPLIGKQANDYCNNELMWNKINEIIEVVNRLEEKVNEMA